MHEGEDPSEKVPEGSAAKQEWAVYRQDFTGNEFLVEKHFSEAEAWERVRYYESHKHHQHYWAGRLDGSSVDYIQLLRESLKSGSPIGLALQVLRDQGATSQQCLEAVCQVKNIDVAAARGVLRAARIDQGDAPIS